jgi:hypothetical protein
MQDFGRGRGQLLNYNSLSGSNPLTNRVLNKKLIMHDIKYLCIINNALFYFLFSEVWFSAQKAFGGDNVYI